MHIDNQQNTLARAIHQNLHQIISEHTKLAEALDYRDFETVIDNIRDARTLFLTASGRSGFSMRSIAMRMMHLGFKTYFVGDTTTPAIQAGDLLWAASGSGTTGAIVRAAEKARQAGAHILAITTNPDSTLATLADTHLLVPAAEKEDHGGERSKQYAGSLFEQSLLLIGDAIFMELWKMDGSPAQTLWKRHANME